MPQLRTFTADIGQAQLQGRRATAEDFGANTGLTAVGRSVQRLGEQILTDTEETESRQALVAASELRAKYARELDDAAISGADTAKIKERMQEDFAKVGENFVTRKGAQSLQLHASNTDLMFDEQTNKIRVQRAASVARLEGSKFLNSTSEVLRANPLYLPFAEQDADAFANTLKDISPEKRAEIAQGLRKELNMAAAVASTRLDPEVTKKRLEQGEWDLTPERREAATQRADAEIRSRRADEAYQRSVKEHEVREADDKARDKFFGDIMGGTAARRSIMDDPDLRPQTREHLIALMESRAKELTGQEKKSDPLTMRDLWLRINAPDGDPKKIYNGDAIFEAVQAGKLNTTDANNLNALVANQKDENNRTFATRLQGRISTIAAALRTSPEYQAQPELAAAIQLELISRAEKAAATLRRENKDPSVLIDDPNDKDYLFKPGIIKAVGDDVKQRMRESAPVVPVVNSQAEYDALEPGTPYVDSKGNRGVKKGAAKKSGQIATGVIR